MITHSAQELLRRHNIAWVSTIKGKYTTECPECSGGYLNVKVNSDSVEWYCHSCRQGSGENFEQGDSSLGSIRAIYDYTDENGKLLFQALRFEPVGGPKQFRQRTGPDQSKWSIKGVRVVPYRFPELLADLASERPVFVVEGEKDVDTLRTQGVPATCNPMGAGKRWPEFNQILRGADVIICGDNDQPGRDHVNLVAKELHGQATRVRILDLRCIWESIEESDDVSDWFAAGGTSKKLWEAVEKISDYKNGNAVLARAEQEEISFAATPGIYRLSELPEPPKLTLWDTGIVAWLDRIFLAPRTLSVVTGQPGHGKTLLWAQIWQHVVMRYGVVACVASFETRPKPHLRRQLRTLYSGVLERDMDEERRAEADRWIDDRYRFLYHPQQRPTIEWILDMAALAVDRHGAKIVQIDPWNRLEAMRNKNETETEYVLRCLRDLSNFANEKNCHVQVIAHPAKMDAARKGRAPELEDIAGSKAWDTVADQGFTIFRPDLFSGTVRRTDVAVFHRKARFEELGYPCKLMANYDTAKGRFDPIADESDEATA